MFTLPASGSARTLLRSGTVTLLALALCACEYLPSLPSLPSATPPPRAAADEPAATADAIPKAEPRSKYGNPPSYQVFGKTYYVLKSAKGYVEAGVASWYGADFHGKRASSGETYDMYAMTAAHKTLPLPTYVEVTNLQSQQRVVLKVNDRGPFKDNRIIDLSYTAARKLGIWQKGTGLVRVRALTDPGSTYVQTAATTTPASGSVAAVVNFYLQVGAFTQADNAHTLKAKLSALHPDIRVITSPGDTGTALHKVQIGPLNTVEQADAITARLSEYDISQSVLVTE